MNEKNQDSIRLDRLSDPKFAMSYSIREDGTVSMERPAALCPSLRSAIDYARCAKGEQPFCIRCKHPLGEENTVTSNVLRYHCPKCDTSFNFTPTKANESQENHG